MLFELSNRGVKNPRRMLCLWIADASTTSHSFRHFCKPSLAHTPIPAATERQGQLPTTPSQELGRFFQSVVVTETSRTQLFLGVSCQVCLCSVRIGVYKMASQHCEGTVITTSLATLPWVTIPHGSPPPHTAPGPAQSSQPTQLWPFSCLGPALQGLPRLLSSSSGAGLTLLHLTATAERLKGMGAGLHNSCLDKRALGPQSKCISPNCHSDFPCSHWRHRGSQETVCC